MAELEVASQVKAAPYINMTPLIDVAVVDAVRAAGCDRIGLISEKKKEGRRLPRALDTGVGAAACMTNYGQT